MEQGKKLKVGLIGAGGIANAVHLPAYSRMKELFDVAAVCDIRRERAEKASEQYGIPAVYENWEEMIKAGGLDAIDICTPNYLHSPMAVGGLNSGLNVFCEKPDAVSVSEAQKMLGAAEKSGRTLMVMRNNRFMPVSSYAKKMIDDGRVGEIYAARCGWQRRRGIPGKGGWFTTKAQSGGGPLIDLGVHMIDLTIWLMGSPKPVTVSGSTYAKFASSNVSDSEHSKFGDQKAEGVFDVEDLAMGFIRFDNGACLQIEFSWASNISSETRFFELRGTKAGIEWSNRSDQLAIYTEEYGKTVDYLPHIDNGAISHHQANIRHFAEVILHGEKPIFVPQQGVDMISILEAMYESARLGHEIRLD